MHVDSVVEDDGVNQIVGGQGEKDHLEQLEDPTQGREGPRQRLILTLLS
jgi:hypothetical protein